MKLTKYEQQALKPLLRTLYNGPLNKTQLSKKFFHATHLVQLNDTGQPEDLHYTDPELLASLAIAQTTLESMDEEELISYISSARNKLENSPRTTHMANYLPEIAILALVKSGIRMGRHPKAALYYQDISLIGEPTQAIMAALA
jgi:hypothetical protein